MYIALKVNGVKLYNLARKGIVIDREPRDINILDIKLISYDEDELSLNIVCSKGTYIRTLVETIGDKLNTGAYTKELRRLRIGHFIENDMVTLENLSKDINKIIHVNHMLDNFKSFVINDSDILRISRGQTVSAFSAKNYDEIAIKDKNNNLLGIGRMANGLIYPKRLIKFDK